MSLLFPSGAKVNQISEGYSRGGEPSYVSGTAASISPFKLDVNGSILERDTAYPVVTTGLPGAVAYLYVYAESDGAGGVTISESSTGPIFDFNKNGWYNVGGTARLINIVPLLGTVVVPFEVTEMHGGRFRMIFSQIELSLDQDPDGTWQEPGTTNVSAVSPVNATEARIAIENYRGTNNYAHPAWVQSELSADILPAANTRTSSWSEQTQAAAFTPTYAGAVAVRRWGALGPSRDIKISDDNIHLNRLSSWLQGVGYGR